MNMKAAASLTGSLLARKGAAYPASYSAPTPSPDGGDAAETVERAYNDPRVIASAPPPPPPAAEPPPPPPVDNGPQMQDGRFAEDIEQADRESGSWAKEPILSAPEPEPEPVAEPVFTPEPEVAPEAEAAPGPEFDDAQAMGEPGLPQTMDKMGRVRLSVRLDPDRYLRVKMASARTRWSAQDIVIAALDKYLGSNGERGAAQNGNGAAREPGDEDAS